MAKSDHIIELVKASTSGDLRMVRAVTAAIIAEERAKQHNVLADRLANVLQSTSGVVRPPSDSRDRAQDYIAHLVPKKRLEDLILPPLLSSSVAQLIEEQQRSSLLRAHGLDARHRVLLVGPPGNGKTSLAEAIAESLAVPLLIVRYEAMIGSFLGETAGRLRRVFDYARTTPCVLFFDEFDAVGKERGDEHETGEIKRVVTSLLMQMDDLPSYTVVVAATNHAELLDRAVWRRFQLRLELPSPTTAQVATYFQNNLPSSKGQLAPAKVAQQLGAISYAEAEQFVMDVKRRLVLSLDQRTAKSVVEEQLEYWTSRVSPNGKALTNGRKAASRDATSKGDGVPGKPTAP